MTAGDDGVVLDPPGPAQAHDGGGRRLAELAQSHLSEALRTPDPTSEADYERSPAAVLRLLVALSGILVVLGLASLLPATHDGLQEDLRERVGSWENGLGSLADAVATGCALLVIVISLGAAFVARRPRQAVTAALAGAGAALTVMLTARAYGTTPGAVVGEEWQLAVVAAAIAIGAASFTVFSAPIVRWSTVVIGTCTIAGVLGSEISLASRVLTLLVGQAVGAAVAAALGTTSRQVTRAELAAGLERARLPVERLERHGGDARGSQPWRAELATGRSVFVKVMALDELRADQLFRTWRRLWLRSADDERSPASVLRAVEHEAFVAQRARSAGVRTPLVVAVGTTGEDDEQPGSAFVVFEAIEGATPDEDPGGLEDPALRSAWSEVQALRRAGIAHRDLRAANLLFDDDGAWVIDFGFAEVAASTAMLERDVAELLASTAALVGNRRAVDAAVAVLGADEIAAAIPWLQPAAVSAATRDALSKSEFEDLREMVRAAAGVSAPEVPQLQRVSWKGVLGVAALGVAIWTLLPQMSEGLDVQRALDAHRGWMIAAVVASMLTYVGAAASISGAVGGAAPLGPTFAAQLASSFTNRITPARVGAMALNLRFLVKQGVEKAAAVTGVAVSTASGTVAHVALTFIAVLWAGRTGFPGVSMPSTRVLLAGAGVVVVMVLSVAFVPTLRHWYQQSLLPAARRGIRSFLEVVRSPRALVMVLGGAALVTVMNVVAFGVSLRAFGEHVPWASVALVYLAGSALASAAPTPGGLGATEAALVGGLVVVDVPEDAAIPSVLLFRLATFWLPILPGWIALVVLQRRGDL